MTKQILSKSLAAFVLVLFASTVTKTFSQTTPNVPADHSLAAGQINNPNPDPTGNGGGGNVALHSS